MVSDLSGVFGAATEFFECDARFKFTQAHYIRMKFFHRIYCIENYDKEKSEKWVELPLAEVGFFLVV